MFGSVMLVEVDGELVPVQYLPLHAAASASMCFADHGAEESRTYLLAAIGRKDEEIFQVQGRQGQERGVGFVDERVTGWSSIDNGKERLNAGAFREEIADEPGLGFYVGRIEMLVFRQCVNEGQERVGIAGL